jgi:hypothetical protein
VEGCCEHGNKLSGFIKCWEILEASQEGLNSMELVSINIHINCTYGLIFMYFPFMYILWFSELRYHIVTWLMFAYVSEENHTFIVKVESTCNVKITGRVFFKNITTHL